MSIGMLWPALFLLSVQALRLGGLTAKRVWQEFTVASGTRLLHSVNLSTCLEDLLKWLRLDTFPLLATYEAKCDRYINVQRLHEIIRVTKHDPSLRNLLLSPACLARTDYPADLKVEIAKKVLPYSPLLLLQPALSVDLDRRVIHHSVRQMTAEGYYPMPDGEWVDYMVPSMLVHRDWHWRDDSWEVFHPSCFERRTLHSLTNLQDRVRLRITLLILNFKLTKPFLLRAGASGDNLHKLTRVLLRVAGIIARFPMETNKFIGIRRIIYGKLCKIFLSLRDTMLYMSRKDLESHSAINNLMLLISNILHRAQERKNLIPENYPAMRQVPFQSKPPSFLAIFNLAVRDLEADAQVSPSRLTHWRMAVLEYYWKDLSSSEDDKTRELFLEEMLKGPCWPMDLYSWLKLHVEEEKDLSGLWIRAATSNPEIGKAVMHLASRLVPTLSRSGDMPELIVKIAQQVVPVDVRLRWARFTNGLIRLNYDFDHDHHDLQRISWAFFASDSLRLPLRCPFTLPQIIQNYLAQAPWYQCGSQWCLELEEGNAMRRLGAMLGASLLLGVKWPKRLDNNQFCALMNRMYDLWDCDETMSSALPFVFTKLHPIQGIELLSGRRESSIGDYVLVANRRLQICHHKLFQLFPLVTLFTEEELKNVLFVNSDE